MLHETRHNSIVRTVTTNYILRGGDFDLFTLLPSYRDGTVPCNLMFRLVLLDRAKL